MTATFFIALGVLSVGLAAWVTWKVLSGAEEPEDETLAPESEADIRAHYHDHFLF